jgi:hypothetical protein
MENEFEKQLSALQLDATTKSKILQIIQSAGGEFPCLSCPSKDDCNSFRWFTKWFGKQSNKQ